MNMYDDMYEYTHYARDYDYISEEELNEIKWSNPDETEYERRLMEDDINDYDSAIERFYFRRNPGYVRKEE